MNSYLLVFDLAKTKRDAFIEKIDGLDEIKNWMFFFENTACIVTDLSAQRITDLLRNELPNSHFIVTGLDRNKRSGWLRKSVWNFIKDSKPVAG